MSGREDNRIFVGGLAWNTSERHLEDAFSRYGKILECLLMVDRDTGRPRGFGFITFADHRAMEDAIREMNDRELDGKVISVNKAQPKMGGEEREPGFGNGYSRDAREYNSGGRDSGRDSYRGADKPAGRTLDCFKCGRPGHFARECPTGEGGGRGDRFGADRGDRFGADRFGVDRGNRFGADRFVDRYDGGRYGDRDRLDREPAYGGRDRFANDRYGAGDRFADDRYVDRAPHDDYSKGRGYSRDVVPRGGGDRYGGVGPARVERGNYGERERPAPYDRPRRGGVPSSYDRY